MSGRSASLSIKDETIHRLTMDLTVTLLFATCISFTFSANCGYESCPETSDKYINIHLVPHTHNDVGWLKTPDQYYYGVNNSIQDAGVQYILDSVVQELLQDSSKKFIYVETYFFWKWWQEQTDAMKQQVKELVDNGQLEFIGGGWSMNDEATTHYQSIIDQMTWGFRRLNDTFGKCGRPKVGWQIDPFGHSRQNAEIMAKMGFDGLFFGRIDWEDKLSRMMQKSMEMLWKTSRNDDTEMSTLFTGILYNLYISPKGFCFDIKCDDEPIVDNVKSPEYNANRKVGEFLYLMKTYSKSYNTRNVLVTMGEDFVYMDAHMYYKNMDKLIRIINSIEGPNSPFRAFYSTPSCYLKSVNDAGVNLPPKLDDFFPYSSDSNSFWTGYFTSRPALKGFERLGNNFLQVCKQLYSLSELGYEFRSNLISLREAMGVMQHHDAITGTEKQHVTSEYARILTNGIKDCEVVTKHALGKLMKNGGVVDLQSCLQLNVSSCHVSENSDSFVVTLYNPLSRFVDRLVRLPTKDVKQSYSVKCPMGKEQLTQIVPIPPSVIQIPGRNGFALAELVFLAKGIPPLGYKSYYISKTSENISFSSEMLPKTRFPIELGFDDGLKLKMTSRGHLKGVKDMTNKKETTLSQSFAYYVGAVGNNEINYNRSSGAYIFRPNSSHILINSQPKVTIFSGPLLAEVQQVFSNWLSQIIRIYNGGRYVECQWAVGPIPIDDQNGKEVVSSYHTTTVHNNGQFYTDSNGRESLLRVLNQRQTWRPIILEPVAGNYYPVTTRISIEDDNNYFSVITDRAEGGSSLSDGTVELMIHRRLLHDDAFGVGEALNETAFGEGLVVRGSHYLSLGNNGQARLLVQEKVLNSWMFFTPTDMNFEDWQSSYNMEYSGLNSALPDNVQILTLEPWSETSFLLRLEHIMEKDDDPELSQPASVDLNDLFTHFAITSVEEMMLGGNMKREESQRLHWNSKLNYKKRHVVKSNIIDLNPMEIRTFIIEMKPSTRFRQM
ncbi:lysosomal alpha-mannosidase-like [Cimex lectularius]|uniref:Alpha-mannosidase n=1 Tax=Cimex lectularius TaxID=79782 RepID=A0A8I6SQ33_CIMLE|nr:lysosomal alpha-mannosidase-like [Cimex lectularius]